jgi:hypothetical protein
MLGSAPSRPLVAAPLVLLVVALFPGALAYYRGEQPWAAGCGYTEFTGWPWADQISLTLVNYVPKTGETPTGAFTLVYYANTDTVGTRRARQLPKQTSAIRAAQRRTSAFGARPSARLSSPMSTSDSRRRRKRQPCGSCQRARHLISASIPRWGSHLRARTARNTVILA